MAAVTLALLFTVISSFISTSRLPHVGTMEANVHDMVAAGHSSCNCAAWVASDCSSALRFSEFSVMYLQAPSAVAGCTWAELFPASGSSLRTTSASNEARVVLTVDTLVEVDDVVEVVTVHWAKGPRTNALNAPISSASSAWQLDAIWTYPSILQLNRPLRLLAPTPQLSTTLFILSTVSEHEADLSPVKPGSCATPLLHPTAGLVFVHVSTMSPRASSSSAQKEGSTMDKYPPALASTTGPLLAMS